MLLPKLRTDTPSFKMTSFESRTLYCVSKERISGRGTSQVHPLTKHCGKLSDCVCFRLDVLKIVCVLEICGFKIVVL